MAILAAIGTGAQSYVQERAHLTAERLKLIAVEKSVQSGPKSKTPSNPKGSGRKQGGNRKVARASGMSETTSRVHNKIADPLFADARKEAEAAGYD